MVLPQLLIWAPVAMLGLVTAWGAGSNGKPVGVIVGVPMILLAIVAVLNPCFSRLRLANGVLSARSLLGRASVRVDAITGISRVELTMQTRGFAGLLFRLWRVRQRFLEPRTAQGPSGIFLDARLYGQRPIDCLISTLKLDADIEVEHRTFRF
jgi:hypothetical protein